MNKSKITAALEEIEKLRKTDKILRDYISYLECVARSSSSPKQLGQMARMRTKFEQLLEGSAA